MKNGDIPVGCWWSGASGERQAGSVGGRSRGGLIERAHPARVDPGPPVTRDWPHEPGENVAPSPRVRLRVVVATIDHELLRLPRRTTHAEGTDGLFDSWSELVRQLALGPAPQLRRCPVCNHLGMSAATLCGYCWSKLAPHPVALAAEQGALGLDGIRMEPRAAHP